MVVVEEEEVMGRMFAFYTRPGRLTLINTFRWPSCINADRWLVFPG